MNSSAQPHPDPAHQPDGGAELSLAALLRLAADDELTAEQRARIEAHLAAHPEDAGRIEFERSLRSACSRACCPSCCAPADLRQRVAAAAQRERAAGGRGGSGARPGERRLTFPGALARFAAVAALVALVAVAGYLAGRAGPGRDRSSGRTSLTGRALASSLAGFVRVEHARCQDGDPAIESKFFITEASAVPDGLSAIAGEPVTIPCIMRAAQRGLRFVDAGPCHPPGGQALHIRFRSQDGAGSLVSLWVQPDDRRIDLQDGVTYTVGEGDDCVRFWRVEGVRYVLVCPDEAAAPAVSVALASPPTIRPF